MSPRRPPELELVRPVSPPRFASDVWPHRHLTSSLSAELDERLLKHALDVGAKDANTQLGALVLAEEARGAVRLELKAMLTERVDHLRLATETAHDFFVPAGPLQASPLLIALLTLPAEVELLRDALTQP